ncbi:DMT family transporter [Hyphobacterium sp. CCMP332]|nr:DMT family transporter [Hyphobacterium sp. CCMP332]
MPYKYTIHAVLFSVGAIYAGNYIIAKEVMPEYVGPFGLIVIRVIIAAAVFWIIHAIWIKEKIKSRKDFYLLLRATAFGVVINQLFFFKGLSLTSPINASLIMTATPILVLISSAIILKEKITKLKMLGVLFGCSGAILLIGNSGFSFSGDTFKGDILVFINACSYGIYLVLIKPIMEKYHPITVVKWIFTLAIPFVTLVGFSDLILVEWDQMPGRIYLSIFYIVAAVTILAYLLNAWSLRYVNASMVGIYIYLQPLLASFLAVLLGKDELTLNKVFFAMLIFSGVYLVSIKK